MPKDKRITVISFVSSFLTHSLRLPDAIHDQVRAGAAVGDAGTADFDECASYGGAGGRDGSVGDCVEGFNY